VQYTIPGMHSFQKILFSENFMHHQLHEYFICFSVVVLCIGVCAMYCLNEIFLFESNSSIFVFSDNFFFSEI